MAQKHLNSHKIGAISSARFLIICFIVITLFVSLTGGVFYQYQKRATISAARTNLFMVADLKARQIGHWRHERISFARLLTSNSFINDQIVTYLNEPTVEIKEKISTALWPTLNESERHTIFLVDNEGNVQLNIGDICNAGEHIDQQQLTLALQQHQIGFGKIHHSHPPPTKTVATHNNHLHMNLIAPIYLNNNQNNPPLGALIIVINPNHFLLPLMTSWPVPSESAESVLVRKAGGQLQRLTPVRDMPNQEALTTRQPPEGIATPGKYLREGKEGFLEGYDYRRVAVFAVVKKVADSPWMLVAKVAQSETTQPLKTLQLIIFIITAIIISITAIILRLWWLQQQAQNQAAYYHNELQNRTIISRFNNLTHFANDIILLCDEEGNIIEANERAIEAYGQTLDELKQKKLRSICDMGDDECSLLWQQLADNQEIQFQSQQFRCDNSTFPVEINANWIEIEDRKFLQAIIRDVSEREQAQQRLTHQAQHDHLTGLPNRTLITALIKQTLAKGVRNNTKTGLLLLDIDRFKNINDTLGHTIGDRLLTTLSERIKKTLRDTDTVARFGGDEFVVMVEDIQEISNLALLATKLSKAICSPVFIDNQEMYVTTSIGISVAPDDASQSDQLIQFADTAMYRAKDLGRNNFQFFTSDMNDHTQERLHLETSLRKALDRNEFVVYYQPQFDLKTQQIIGSEALIRWQHPERGLVPPNDFIPLAEETGLIDQIGQWVLEQACKQNKIWQQDGFTELTIAVNLSARQFLNKHLSNDIFNTLVETELLPQYLELELTESLLMHDVESSIELMNTLSNKGISLAIDDFGTGYSSLSYLHRFPIDKLKIDRSFVSPIGESNDTIIARTIIALAQEMRLRIIAEGIETEEQLKFLRQFNCHTGQGYYFSRPVPAVEFTELLQKQKNQSET
jgi:diguanylate cyclase (GGDEF)-like protein/PAS domain S-box-containing protein